jgi:uncharacterized protein (DUF1499 family)
VAGPIVATVGVVPPLVGFALFALGGILGLVAAVAGVVALVRGGKGGTAIVLGGVPGALLVGLLVPKIEFPRINDITTDLADPPSFRHAQSLPANQGRDLGYPDGFKEIVRGAYPDLRPARLAAPPAGSFDRALLVARAMPDWEITSTDRDALSFEAVATSRLFHFQDDVVVRVRGADGGSVVDVRSKSRDGRGDLGANAARIREFTTKLQAGWPADAK